MLRLSPTRSLQHAWQQKIGPEKWTGPGWCGGLCLRDARLRSQCACTAVAWGQGHSGVGS